LPHDFPIGASSLSAAPEVPSGALGSELLDLPFAEAKRRAIAAFEDAYVEGVMQRCGGNTSEAARQAGLDRSNFRRLLRKGR